MSRTTQLIIYLTTKRTFRAKTTLSSRPSISSKTLVWRRTSTASIATLLTTPKVTRCKRILRMTRPLRLECFPHLVGDVPTIVTISEIIAVQNTDDFCQTVFTTMHQAKSFFFEVVYFFFSVDVRQSRSSSKSWPPMRFALVCFTSPIIRRWPVTLAETYARTSSTDILLTVNGSMHRPHITLLSSLRQKPVTSHPPEEAGAFSPAKQPL